MEQVYALASAAIVHEVIDGEAIIMDMRSGSYYSTDGSGALIWSAAMAGASRARMLQTAEQTLPGAGDDALRFLDSLLAADLLQAEMRAEVAETDLDFNQAGVWEAPVLSSHHDMQDMLLLDPIHQVDGAGWPMPRDAQTDAESETAERIR